METKLIKMLSALSLILTLNVQDSFPQSQHDPFQLQINAHPIPGMPALHSFSWAKFQNKWLIIGGRNNGLHGFQPPFAFPTANQNDSIFLVDPDSNLTWKVSTNSLPLAIQEHIISSNQQFTQVGNHLYITGGYGYMTSQNTLWTFPAITRIDVSGLASAIRNQTSILPYFQQIEDSRMAVTGGHMVELDSTFLLVFGHEFNGRYNPHNGSSFSQTYTESIRSFRMEDSAGYPVIRNYAEQIDTANFHRRDYNLVPQVFPNGDLGYTGFTGVFQKTDDLPWLNSVDIIQGTGVVNNSFQQKLNQYHTANLSLYDSIGQVNYTVFFGGMGWFYPDSTGAIIIDSLVPFVKTVSYIERSATQIQEGWFSINMPGYLGASAEFIPAAINEYPNEVLKLHSLDSGWHTLGYIVGGIESDTKNIFMQGTGSSWASSMPYEVRIFIPGTVNFNSAPKRKDDCFVLYPNPSHSVFFVKIQGLSFQQLNYQILTTMGALVRKGTLTANDHLQQEFKLTTEGLSHGVYTLLISDGNGFLCSRRFTVK